MFYLITCSLQILISLKICPTSVLSHRSKNLTLRQTMILIQIWLFTTVSFTLLAIKNLICLSGFSQLGDLYFEILPTTVAWTTLDTTTTTEATTTTITTTTGTTTSGTTTQPFSTSTPYDTTTTTYTVTTTTTTSTTTTSTVSTRKLFESFGNHLKTFGISEIPIILRVPQINIKLKLSGITWKPSESFRIPLK